MFGVLLAIFADDAQAVTMNWSAVGNAVNANDPATGNLYGGVGYNYNIGTYDVTNNQYIEFLNAKDPTAANTLGLWNTNMGKVSLGGIRIFDFNPPGSKYGLISGDRGDYPVNYETWYDAVRFANWMNNGQGNGSTETGAYTLLGGTATPSNGASITRNAGATIFLPSESEWYKAAYNNPGGSTYNLYPTSSSLVPTASAPTGLANHVNYNNAVGNFTDVGAYTGTTSPYGAFDMGGNISQWNEALAFGSGGLARVIRGGAFVDTNATALQSSNRNVNNRPTNENGGIGFRVANIPGGFVVPEPSTGMLAVIACGMLWWWRKRFK